jgi:hypothetical protein
MTATGNPMIIIPSSLVGSLIGGQSFTLTLSFSAPSKTQVGYNAQVYSDPLGP